MPPRTLPPTRRLRTPPDLDQLKRQAKELLHAFRAGDDEAIVEVRARYRGADPAMFALHDAQLVLARSYGFDSWPKLKAYVDGVTVARLVEAVRAHDVARVRAMLKARPEIVDMDLAENDEHRALHVAVLDRSPAIVRLLMAHGADARKGIYPHRDATSALVLATDRGDDEIAAIIREEEEKRARQQAQHERERPHRGSSVTRDTGEVIYDLVTAIRDGDTARARTLLEAHPSDDLAAVAAVARGDADWLRAPHAAGALTQPSQIDIFNPLVRLLTIAVFMDRPEMVSLLLDLGFDPDERMRLDQLDEVVYSWGGPLHLCADTGRHAIAELLLARGADPNGEVYASGSIMYKAYERNDAAMIALLERHGGRLDAGAVGWLRLTDVARRMFADEDAGRLLPDPQMAVDPSRTAAPLAETFLYGAMNTAAVEIVRMSLARVDWPRDDTRWHWLLWGTLFDGHSVRAEADRERHYTCFRLLLERCDARAIGRFGRTILHDLAGAPDTMGGDERVTFATMFLDAGGRLDARDDLLRSTPLGWACRWGRTDLVRLFLDRGADPIEADAEPWATPLAWAEKRGHDAIRALLQSRAASAG